MTDPGVPSADPVTSPYGTWRSPISAELLAASGHGIGSPTFAGADVWWAEQRPDEGGRAAVRRLGPDGAVDVLPAPWNARSRVHEYGGGAWAVTSDAVLVFVEFSDQRLYRLDRGASDPVALTPASEADAGGPAVRFGDLAVSADGREVWAVRETHVRAGVIGTAPDHTSGDGTAPDGMARDGIVRDLIAVPLDGSAADEPDRVRSIVSGSDFLASARVSPDGRRVAWVAWNHPQMPWDGTEVRTAELGADGRCGPARTLLGSSTESVLQPEWDGDGHLYVLSDRSGWWNLYRVAVEGEPDPVAIAPVSMDVGGPMWTLGRRWYRPLDDGSLLAVRTLGTDRLARLDPGTGEWTDVDLGGLSTIELGGADGARVLVCAGGARTPLGVRLLDLSAAPARVREVRLGVDHLPANDYFADGDLVTFPGPGGRDVHAIVYPPTNPGFRAPAGELPPYVTLVHGGPTSQFTPLLDLDVAYLTSRGIGVLAVNYGGSTGYGRDYRRRLNGEWGVVDVADTVAAVRGLIASGRADPDRVAIQGGSAGGWTVLSALTTTDVFACGVSYYGVTDLMALAADTHDFESRYLDGLVGPLPQARAVYERRSPMTNLAGLSCPVLLLQGLDDPVVPPSQAEQFRDVLLAKGIVHAYRPYAGESHGFRRRETLIDSAQAALSFFGQVLGFTPPDVPVLDLWRP